MEWKVEEMENRLEWVELMEGRPLQIIQSNAAGSYITYDTSKNTFHYNIDINTEHPLHNHMYYIPAYIADDTIHKVHN